jgi:hypothetical protein
MTDPDVLAKYVDMFIVGLLTRAGLKVQVKRTATATTLKIALKRTNTEAKD